MSRRITTLVACLLCLLFVVTTGQGASAHSRLLSASPAQGENLSEFPQSVVLTFNEDIRSSVPTISVTGPQGSTATAGEATIKGPVVSAPLTPSSTPGVYKVAYAVSSQDGSRISGRIEFNFDPNAAKGGIPWWVVALAVLLGAAVMGWLVRRRRAGALEQS